jgi:hypothetical protein
MVERIISIFLIGKIYGENFPAISTDMIAIDQNLEYQITVNGV